MPLADLFSDEGVVNFAVNNLDRAAFQSDHWTFLHIPKTAGSSFREEIANALQPDYNVEVDYHDLDPANTSGDFTGKMHTALSTYINQGFFKDTKFASGHFTYRELAQFEEFSRSKLISMLREPIARLRSDYTFRTSPEHPLWESEIQRYPNFKSYIEHPDNRNVMYRYLSRDEEEPVQDGLKFILQKIYLRRITRDVCTVDQGHFHVIRSTHRAAAPTARQRRDHQPCATAGGGGRRNRSRT